MGFFNKSKKKNNATKTTTSISSSTSNISTTNDINQGETISPTEEQITTTEYNNYVPMSSNTASTNQQKPYQLQIEDNNNSNYVAPALISPTAAPSDEFHSPVRGTTTAAYPMNNSINEQQQQQLDQTAVDSSSIPQSPSYEQTVSAATAFVNEQVGKVRQLAEEGPLSFRVLAFLGGVAMIVTSVLDWIGELFGFSMHKFLISLYTFSFGIIICILEGRMFVPETHKYQQKFIIYAKLLKYVWGRGLFYFFAGTLQFSQMRILDMASGSFMIFVGIISLVIGNRTAKKLSKLSQSIAADEDKLFDKFMQYSSSNPENRTNDERFLEQADFAELVHDIGLNLDNNEHIAAFATIDDDDDGKISFDDLKSWWSGFNSKTSHEVSLLV